MPPATEVHEAPAGPRLTIRSVRAVGVEVPMRRPLGTSQGTIRAAPLLLIDVETEEGVTGRSYVFCYVAAVAPAIVSILAEVERTVKGDRLAPLDLWAKLSQRFRLIGIDGIVRMAISGVEVASWDALAVAGGKPLGSMIGATVRSVQAYNSNGLGLMPIEELADEAEALLEGGFRAVKLRLGRPSLDADLAAVRAVRRRLPDQVALMVDFNQALDVPEAIRRGRALDDEGVYWIEEPVRHDDYRGCAEVARAVRTPIQIGENFSSTQAMSLALDAVACDYVMPDLERIGGVAGWQRAAALAEHRGIQMSSHLLPEVSAHLLAATPTRHWLEYVDWADPILVTPLSVVDGAIFLTNEPGTGISWNQEAVIRYRMP